MKLEGWLPVLVAAVVGGAAVSLMPDDASQGQVELSPGTTTAVRELSAEVRRLHEVLSAQGRLLSASARSQVSSAPAITSAAKEPGLLQGAPVSSMREPHREGLVLRAAPAVPPARTVAVTRRLRKLLAPPDEEHAGFLERQRTWLLVGEDVVLHTLGVPDEVNVQSKVVHWIYAVDGNEDEQVIFTLHRGRVMRID